MNWTVKIAVLVLASCTLASCGSAVNNVSETNDLAALNDNVTQSGKLILDGSEKVVIEAKKTPVEYVNFIKNATHLHRTKTIAGVDYRLSYLPTEYMVCNELKSNEISKAEFIKALEGFVGTEYYMLQIEVPGTVTELAKVNLTYQQQYQERIAYLSFGMQSDIKAISDDGTEVFCNVYHFERTYNATPYSTFIIGFPDDELEHAKERTIALEDKLFNNGLIKFNWSTDQLKVIPQITLL
ncbi:MAG: hypothetical protein JKY54_16500 [Flavobacteriales bacterium]|nr:hypothetical protein [Flavobacteriales bacterium]